MQKINLFNNPILLNYYERDEDLIVETKAAGKSEKRFPVYYMNGVKYIFKPLSAVKPFSTSLFACAEVFNSYIAKKYFDPNTPLYKLAECRGINGALPKYYDKGVLVPSYLNYGEKNINLMEYLRSNSTSNDSLESSFEYCVSNFFEEISPYKYSNHNLVCSSGKMNDYVNYAMSMYNFEPIFDIKIFAENPKYAKQLAIQYLLSLFTRNHNFHYENINFRVCNNEIKGLVPPNDQEYSLMFLYPENNKQNKKLKEQYLKLFSDNTFIIATIKKITERYPDIINDFIIGLNQFIIDFTNFTVPLNSNFIGQVNSEKWHSGYFRYKEKKESVANFYDLLYKDNFNVDCNQLMVRILTDYLESAFLLKNILQKNLEEIHGIAYPLILTNN